MSSLKKKHKTTSYKTVDNVTFKHKKIYRSKRNSEDELNTKECGCYILICNPTSTWKGKYKK